MIRKTVLVKYARSLAEVAFEACAADVVEAQYALLVDLAGRVPALVPLWRNPVVPAGVKAAVAVEIARQAGFHPFFREFLLVLVKHYRIAHVVAIYEVFKDELNRLRGVVRALASTARPLDGASLAALASTLESLLKTRVRLDTVVDPDLLGGVKVEASGTVYDGTVRRRIEKMKARVESSL